MLDFDRAQNAPAQDWPFLDRELTSLVPELKQVTRLWQPSASAFIYDAGSGAQINGPGNWRCYCVVDNAAAIPATGAAIYVRYWQAGHGWIYISRLGTRSTARLSTPPYGNLKGWTLPPHLCFRRASCGKLQRHTLLTANCPFFQFPVGGRHGIGRVPRNLAGDRGGSEGRSRRGRA